MRWLKASILLLACSVSGPGQTAVELQGEPVQGGLMFGRTAPGSTVTLDGEAVLVAEDGSFVIGFGRDEDGTRTLRIASPEGTTESRSLPVQARAYKIERVDGLPPSKVTPDPEALERIEQEAQMVRNARAHRDQKAWYAAGFTWPARGRISGVYGSQRILNGEPRSPHYGLDIAAPEGAEVIAPADGLVTLTHPDMYYSGGTIVLDHGQGLSSAFLHLSKIMVEAGVFVKQGEVIGLIGSTGRVTGPHLDWRMNWLDKRVDPQPLVSSQDQQ